MVEIFLSNLQPRPLAKVLKDRRLKTVNANIGAFIAKYREGMRAKGVLKTIEGESRPEEQKTAQVQVSAVKEAAKLPAVTPATSSGPPPEWKATKTCHQCGVYGHVRTDCPQLKRAVQTPKQINVMRAAEPPPDGPYLPIEVESPNGAGPLCVRMVGHLDSGSDFDGMRLRFCLIL